MKGLSIPNDEKKQLLDIIVQGSSDELFERIIENVSKYFISKSSYVIDGGANIGRHTQHFIESVGENGKVYAVEAVKPLLAKLSAKFISRKQYVPINKALYNISCLELNFNYIVNGSGYSGINLRELPEGFNPEIEILKVQSITMDDMVDTETRKCSFIKLDLEGAEYFALVGAKGILEKDRPVVVFEDGRSYVTQWYDYDCRQMYEYFSSLDYCLVSIFAEHLDSFEKWMEWNPWYTFALPREMAAGASVILEKFCYELIGLLLAEGKRKG